MTSLANFRIQAYAGMTAKHPHKTRRSHKNAAVEIGFTNPPEIPSWVDPPETNPANTLDSGQRIQRRLHRLQ